MAPSILKSADKDVVRRAVPSPSNHIITVAVARLYVNYPDPNRWNFTGISGALVLAEDKVGKTFFFKIVDIKDKTGVLWDQEIYDGFQYNHDRTFFHTFELEECMAGFSFADEKEAGNFYKKVEKTLDKAGLSGSPATSGGGLGLHLPHLPHLGSSKSPLSRSATVSPAKQPAVSNGASKTFSMDSDDPAFKNLLAELKEMGVTDDMIRDNEDWIRSLLEEKWKKEQAEEEERRQLEAYSNGRAADNFESHSAVNWMPTRDKSPLPPAPPPPPPPPSHTGPPPPPPPPPASRGTRNGSLSPQVTGSSTMSRRGPPPPPPPARRGGHPVNVLSPRPASPSPAAPSPPPPPPPPSQRHASPEPPRTQSPPQPPHPKFSVPPPLPDAGARLHHAPPAPPRPSPGPPSQAAPPLPPKVADDGRDTGHRFGVPPPFVPPAPPSRAPPPSLPSRPPGGAPPPPPPRLPVEPPSALPPRTPPALPAVDSYTAPPPPPPPMPPSSPPSAPPAPPSAPPAPPSAPPAPPSAPPAPPSAPPAPPPMPPSFNNSAPPPPAPPMPPGFNTSSPPPPPMPPGFGSSAPPPPPLPPTGPGAPPPPPPMPPMAGAAAAPPKVAPPQVDGRDNLLASIRGAGVKSLKKVPDSQKRIADDPIAAATGKTAGGAKAGGGAPANPMQLVQEALNQRKKKMASNSDDESDGEW